VTNQILMGVPAEVALLSLELDAHRVADAHSFRRRIGTLPQRGVLNRTPFVILVREGNPKNIRDSPISRVKESPSCIPTRSLGRCNWALLAEYGAAARGPGGKSAGERASARDLEKRRRPASSARAARTQF